MDRINTTWKELGQDIDISILNAECVSIMMMVMCSKQHISNIWNWSQGKKVKQHWG